MATGYLQQLALSRIWSTAPTFMRGWDWLEVPGTDKAGHGRASAELGHGVDGGFSGGSWM